MVEAGAAARRAGPREAGPWWLQPEGELRAEDWVAKAQWGGGDRAALEDSGLILGAEAPL